MARHTGRLVLVATPIGNLEDLSARAVRTLAEADVVAVEDTRRTGRLLAHAGVDAHMVTYHEHNEERRGPELLDRVARGETVALVSDAGLPGLADPGYRIVREAIARDLPVAVVPGPVAALHALVASGLPTDRFVFEGFLPRKAAQRSRRLEQLATEARTLVFYVAPHRAADDLRALAAAFGADRPAALARELTKLHEEVWRGPLGQLAARAAEGVRGEITVVVGGAPGDPAAAPAAADLAERVRQLIATGVDRKDALRRVAKEAGVPRSVVYDALLDR